MVVSSRVESASESESVSCRCGLVVDVLECHLGRELRVETLLLLLLIGVELRDARVHVIGELLERERVRTQWTGLARGGVAVRKLEVRKLREETHEGRV